jgi:hypothetical protein
MVRVFLMLDLAQNLGEKSVQGFDRGDRALQRLPLAERHNILRRVLQTYAINSTLGGQQFDSGGRQISPETVNVNCFFYCRNHLLLLILFEVLQGYAGGLRDAVWEDCLIPIRQNPPCEVVSCC